MPAHVTRADGERFFKKCHIYNAVDEMDDDMCSIVVKKDGNIRSECEEDEGTDLEGGDSDTDW